MERQNRDERDAAGIGPYAQEREVLVPMSSLESWTVSPGEPDIRGWEVRTASGRQLGVVSDLLIDESQCEVVLIDVDLPGTDRHTFAPIRVVQIDRGKHLVVMDSADLPESNVARETHAVGRDASARGGTVRYPVADREARTEAPKLADTVSRSSEPPEERRHAQRRRIDRISTDF
jgi:hypothetical protein